MKILKVHVIQPGISDEPIEVIGIFPYKPKELESLHTYLLKTTSKPTEIFNNYVKEDLHSCIDNCTPLAVKKSDGLITIILQPNDIDNKDT